MQLVQMLRAVDHQPFTDRLPDRRGAAAANRQRHAFFRGNARDGNCRSCSVRGTTTPSGNTW